jgi:uncharacterized membrane protein
VNPFRLFEEMAMPIHRPRAWREALALAVSIPGLVLFYVAAVLLVLGHLLAAVPHDFVLRVGDR